MKGVLLFGMLFFFLIFSGMVRADTSVSQCAVLDQNNTVYTMSSDFTNSTATVCLNITAYNSTLDCQGHNVKGGGSNTGIYIKSGTNDTVVGCNVTGWNYGIYLQSASGNVLKDNLVSGCVNWGIYLYSYSTGNTLLNNTANGNNAGVYLLSHSDNNVLVNNTFNGNTNGYAASLSSNNSVRGGSIASSATVDYNLDNIASTTNFTDTNFTASRTIQFLDTASNDATDEWFNYMNGTSPIWLRMNNIAEYGVITRSLNRWSFVNISWDESDSGADAANYTISGLLLNTNYTVFNGTSSASVYLLNSSTSGKINFTLMLNSTSRTIQVNSSMTPVPSLNLTFNTSDTVYQGDSVLIGCDYPPELSVGLYNDSDDLIGNPTVQGTTDLLGNYFYECITDGNENYTSASVNRTLTVLQVPYVPPTMGSIVADIGSGMGAFLSAIAMPLGYLILVLGIIGGVVSFFMAIAAVIRKAL